MTNNKKYVLWDSFVRDCTSKIEDHIYFMGKEEVEMILEIKNACKLIDTFRYDLPKEKEKLYSLLVELRSNCWDYYYQLSLPNNKALAVIIRTLLENLIVLKFLLKNESYYTKNWSFFVAYDIKDEKRRNEIEGIEIFIDWENDFKKQFLDEKSFKVVTSSKYGWAYPLLKGKITLKSISDYLRTDYEYKLFSIYSSEVHNSDGAQNYRSRNYGDTTIINCYRFMDIIYEYVVLLNGNIVSDEDVKQKIIHIYDKIKKIRRKFLNKQGVLIRKTNELYDINK